MIFYLLSALKIISILSLILFTFLLVYHKFVELFKLVYNKVFELFEPNATAAFFIPETAYMKAYAFLNRSIGSFLFILTILGFYSALFPEWLYDQVAFVDSYAYLGHILNPFIQRNGFPSHPSGDLLPAIFPGYLFHAVFHPIFANFIYKTLLAATTTFLLFRILKKYFGVEVAILSIFVTLSNSFFLASMGSYYVLSIVIFYLTSVLFFIVKAGENTTKWRFLYLGLIGFSISCMMSSAVLTVVFTPGFLILFYGLKRMEKGRLSGLEDVFIPIGFVLGILFFCIIHYSYTNTFIYFHSTIDKIFGFLDMNRTPGRVSAWIFKARWLGLSAIILFYSLLKLILAKKELIINIIDTMKLKFRPENLFIIICNINFMWLAYLQLFRNQGTISDPYYFSQGIPIVTLGLISIFYKEYQLPISKSMLAHIGVGLLCLLIGYHFQSDLFLHACFICFAQSFFSLLF